MAPLPHHPLTLHYIYLKVMISILRFFAWLFMPKLTMHVGVDVETSTIPSREKGRNIKVLIYTPFGYDKTQKVPVLVNFHG